MHPVLFRIGDFSIGTYGLAVVAGLFSAMWLSRRLGRRCGIPPDFYYDLVFLVMVSGFIGARLFFIGLNWNNFLGDPAAYIFSRQGFVYLGGFFVATMSAILFIRRRKLPLLAVGDTVVPAVALSHVFGRLGCFSAGCCYGKIVPANGTSGWMDLVSIRYPLAHQPDGRINPMFNFAYHTQEYSGMIQQGMPPLPVLPVQLFEAAGNLGICCLLLWFWGRLRFSGHVFTLYLLFYGIMRFFLEYLRGDVDRGLYFNETISTSQIISLIAIAAGLTMMTVLRHRGARPALSSADVLGRYVRPGSERTKYQSGSDKNIPSKRKAGKMKSRRGGN